MVLNAGLGVCDALADGKGGSFMSVMVHSVHDHSVPRIATRCGLFGCDCRPWPTLPPPAWLSSTVLCRRVCRAQARACLSTGSALNRCFAWTFGTASVLAQGVGATLVGIPALSIVWDMNCCSLNDGCASGGVVPWVGGCGRLAGGVPYEGEVSVPVGASVCLRWFGFGEQMFALRVPTRLGGSGFSG